VAGDIPPNQNFIVCLGGGDLPHLTPRLNAKNSKKGPLIRALSYILIILIRYMGALGENEKAIRGGEFTLFNSPVKCKKLKKLLISF